MRSVVAVLGAMALLVVASGMANATLATGPIINASSWGQRWVLGSTTPHNYWDFWDIADVVKIEVVSLSGSPFEVPAISGLSGGWTYSSGNTQWAIAQGPSTGPSGSLYFTTNWQDPQQYGTQWDLYAWNSQGFGEQQRFT